MSKNDSALPAESANCPVGMKAWTGGDSAPEDWDHQRPIEFRSGVVAMHPGAWSHLGFGSDIIAYTPKANCPVGGEANYTPYKAIAECDTAAIRAVRLLEDAEDFHANCDECEGEGVPELCAECFPYFDAARVERRLVMQSLEALPPAGAGDVGYARGVEDGETWESINRWCDDTFGLATVPQIIARAKEEFDELETPGANHAIEAADVVICLCRIPGFAEALQAKMAINRKRKWRLVGNGTGYHIPEDSALSARKDAAIEGGERQTSAPGGGK